MSVLGNNDLDLVGNGRGGRGLIVAVRVVFFVLVIFLAVEHEDYIRILLNRARFTQIGQLRAVGFSSALGASGELGAADDGDIQILRHELEASGYLSNLLHAAFDLCAGANKSEVIYNNTIDVLESACARFHLGDGYRARIVKIQLAVVERSGSKSEAGPVIGIELAGSHLCAEHARFGGEHSLRELLFRHFEREEENFLLSLDSDVSRNIQGKACLSHCRARADKYKVGFVESGDNIIKIPVAG